VAPAYGTSAGVSSTFMATGFATVYLLRHVIGG